MYQKKDGKSAVQSKWSDKGTTLRYENGEEVLVTDSTLNRWWKKDGFVETNPEPVETKSTEPKVKKEKVAKEKVEKEPKAPGLEALVLPIVEKLGATAELMANKKSCYIITMGGIRKAMFTSTLFAVRPKVAELSNLLFETKKYNNPFKGKLVLPESDAEKVALFEMLIKL